MENVQRVEPETSGLRRLADMAEVAVVFLGREFFAPLAIALALSAGIVLPDMPLLRHTYLVFVFVLVLMLWLKLRGETWSTFGLIAPRKWGRYLVFGVLLAVVGIAVDNVVRPITTPLIVAWTGANPHLDEQTFADIKGNLPLYLMVLPCIWLFAAFGEEFLFRGYLLQRLAQIFGGGRAAWALAVVGQAIAFGLAHMYQGPVGVVNIGIGAIVVGAATVVWGRNLWPAMIAHGLVDTLGFTMLYLGMPLS